MQCQTFSFSFLGLDNCGYYIYRLSICQAFMNRSASVELLKEPRSLRLPLPISLYTLYFFPTTIRISVVIFFPFSFFRSIIYIGFRRVKPLGNIFSVSRSGEPLDDMTAIGIFIAFPLTPTSLIGFVFSIEGADKVYLTIPSV